MNESTSETADQSTPPSGRGSLAPHIIAVAIVIAALVGAFQVWRVQQSELARGEAIALTEVGPPLTEFELTDRSGKKFHSADMKGKVWVASYFFSTCPGSCLRLNQNIQFLNNLPELKDVTWVSITCDPDNDSQKVLADYADRWKADPDRWLFCRADMDYTKRVALGMNIVLERKGHQDYAIVVDKAGKIRGVYDGTSKSQCERLVTRLIGCMAEEPPKDLAVSKAKHEPAATEKNST